MLDLAIYAQHAAAHAVPLLWRIHRVHHADLDLDVTSGIRFHPAEIVLSMSWKLIVILVLGPLPVAVIAFEILLNASSLFNHGNLALPDRVDGWMRHWIVTPDMHRIHHSVIHDEMNSNFGFMLPWWDHVFKTYLQSPRSGQTGMTIGLIEWRQESDVQPLGRLLLIPFRDVPAQVKTDPNRPSQKISPATTKQFSAGVSQEVSADRAGIDLPVSEWHRPEWGRDESLPRFLSNQYGFAWQPKSRR